MAALSFDDLVPAKGGGVSFDDLVPASSPSGPPAKAGLSTSIADQNLASTQGVSATVPKGAKLAPQEVQDAFGELGSYLPLDTSKYAVLRSPDTGQLAVYERTPEMDQNVISRLGHFAMNGIIAPVARLGSIVGPASKGEAVAAAAARQGIPMTPGMVFDNPAVRTVENVAGRLPGSSGTVEARQGASIAGTANRVEGIASELGTATGDQSGGTALKQGAEAFVSRPGPAVSESVARSTPTREIGFDRKSDALYSRVDRYVPGDTATPMAATRDALTAVTQRFQNPELAKEFQDSALGRWAGILDRANGNLSWSDAKQLRTQIGGMLRKGELVSGVDSAELKRVYGALTDDLRSAAAAQGPEALRAFEQASGYYAAGLERINGAIKALTKQTEGGAFDLLVKTANEKGAKASEATLTAIRRSIPADEWGDVAAAVTRRLGASTQVDEGFSPTLFVKNYEAMSDRAKNLLFNGAQKAAMDDLLTVAKSQRALERAKNAPNSGAFILTGGIGAGLAVDPISTVASLAGAGVATRLLMNPGVVRWLAAVNRPRQVQGVAANAARLGSLAKVYPQDADAILALKNAYTQQRSAPASEDTDAERSAP